MKYLFMLVIVGFLVICYFLDFLDFLLLLDFLAGGLLLLSSLCKAFSIFLNFFKAFLADGLSLLSRLSKRSPNSVIFSERSMIQMLAFLINFPTLQISTSPR